MSRTYDFVEKPPDEYFCPVSFELLLTAQQTSCCGKHLSENVADKLESNNKPCPMCNCLNLNTHKDIHYRRLVGQVKIYCDKKSKGCKWQGEVQALERHLSYGSVSKGDCMYLEVPCPYACRRHIARNKLKDHMNNDCQKRPFKCNYCNEEGSYNYVVNSHLPICDKFPTKCPKGCGELLCRNEIKNHLATKCPLQDVTCEFGYAGCNTQDLCRKDTKRHLEDNAQAHLSFLATYYKEKDREIEALKAQVQTLTNALTRSFKSPVGTVAPNAHEIAFIPPPTLAMRKFSEFRSRNEKWKSPAFYSHIGGYKMCLLVLPNSQVDNAGNKRLGVYLQMLRGEYDDLLKWPFHGKVVVRMLNQLADENHIELVLLDASSYRSSKFQVSMVDRVTGAEPNSCWGCANFVPMKNLETNSKANTQYLREDSLMFQVVDVCLLHVEDYTK